MKTHLKNFTILAITLVVIIISSCKKDKDIKTATDYLTAGNWKITAATIDPGIDIGTGMIITDVYAFGMEECNRDDLAKFNTDGTISWDEGAMKCDENDPQTRNEGHWTLSEDGKTLTFTSPDEDEDPIVNTVETLNESTLKYSYEMTVPEMDGNGSATYALTVTSTLQ